MKQNHYRRLRNGVSFFFMGKSLIRLCALMLVFLLSVQAFAQRQTENSFRSKFGPNYLVGYLAYTPVDYAANPTKNYPILIFLHGTGEKVWKPTNTSQLYKLKTMGPAKEIESGKDFPFIVISPQCPFAGWDDITTDDFATTQWRPGEFVDEIIEKMKTLYRVDPSRIYVTGLSMGGASTWEYVANYPNKVAAAIPIAGWAITNSAKTCDIGKVPVWGFQGGNDNGTGMTNWVNSINACTPTPNPLVKLTVYPGVGHDAWTRTYDNSATSENIYTWLMKYSKTGTNANPFANAGVDRIITLPTNSLSITGTGTDSDGTVASYAWTKVSGGAATITAGAAGAVSISGLVAGTYVFRLTVTDNQGATGSDDVTIKVNAANVPPAANAGTDKSITLPTSTLSITGTGTDSDGSVTGYTWTKVSGGAATLANASTATVSFSGLVVGTYVFRLTVTDNTGATGSDDVTVVVNPAPTGIGDGLSAEYFNGVSLAGTPLLKRVDETVNFDWLDASPAAVVPVNQFSARWTGKIKPLYSESYTFYTTSDDGIRLYVNNALVIDNWTYHGAVENTGIIALTAGQLYDIRLEYFEGNSMATAKLSWSSASQVKQIVPKAQLYSNTTPVVTGNGLKGEYYNTLDFTGTVLTRTDSVINFEWNNNPPFTGVNTDNYSVRWTGKVKANYSETYTFYTTSDDGVRLWVNNTLLIDNWTNHAAVENSGTIALVAGQQYDIRLEYYEKTSLATAKLSWSSVSQVKQIIPRVSLFLPSGARQVAASVNSFDINSSEGILTTYPNPAKDFVNVQFNSAKAGSAEIVLINETSREVLKKSVSVAAGENAIPVSLSEVNNGMYVMVITIDGKKQSTRLVVGK